MRVAALLVTAGLVALAAGSPFGAGGTDATTFRQCKTVNPAPVQTRCTLLVGTAHLGIVGAGFVHTPCVGAAGQVVVREPCYVGTMRMELSWSGGVWTKSCNQVIGPQGAMQDQCTSAGVKPPGGSAFSVQCQSYHLSTQSPPSFLVGGGVGPVGCYVAITQ